MCEYGVGWEEERGRLGSQLKHPLSEVRLKIAEGGEGIVAGVRVMGALLRCVYIPTCHE